MVRTQRTRPALRTFAGLAAMSLLATAGLAQDVRLQSAEGNVDVSGRLISFENGFYEIETAFGPLQVEAAMVTCTGACPETAEKIRLAGNGPLSSRMMPHIVAGFADRIGASTEPNNGGLRALDGEAALFEASFVASSPGDETADLVFATLPSGAQPALSTLVDGLSDQARAVPIAVDGLVFVLHPDNPIDALSLDELSAVLSGQTTDWSQLGGENGEISVVAPAEGGLADLALRELFLTPRSVNMSSGAITVADDAAVTAEVMSNPNAIGVLGLGADSGPKRAGIIGACGLTPRPTEFAALAGEYPLHRTLVLLSDAPAGTAAELAVYASSDEARPAIAAAGLVHLSILREDQNYAARRTRAAIDIASEDLEVHALRELYIDMIEWDRLSATFRTDANDFEGDMTVERELARLADYIDTLPAGTEIMLTGFSDSRGTLPEKLDRSRARADAIYDRFLQIAEPDQLNGKRIETKGFADLKPVGCFADPEGEALNRRVEVWVRR